MADQVTLLDTTLRDGQLSPDVRFSSEERIEIACALESAGLDVIEVAFPGMCAEDLSSARVIVKQIREATVCCLARMDPADIDIAADLLSGCANPRLHVYLGGKSIRSLGESKTSRDHTLRMVKHMVSHARSLIPDVEFSPQDATRVEFESLVAITRAALAGGAGIVNFSDTTGTSGPEEIRGLFLRLFEAVPELNDAVVSLHGHDHLGHSIDNALSAICAGARQIEGTINGIGPAGGNTDLLKVVGMIETKANSPDIFVQADYQRLLRISQWITKTIDRGPKQKDV